MAEESLEKAMKQREQTESNEKENQKKEQLKNDFNNLNEVKNLNIELDSFINDKTIDNKEKEKINTNLLIKYEKNPKNFDLMISLEKVFFGEKTNPYNNGIHLEGNKVEIFNKISLTDNEIENISKINNKEIEQQEIVENKKELKKGTVETIEGTSKKVIGILNKKEKSALDSYNEILYQNSEFPEEDSYSFLGMGESMVEENNNEKGRSPEDKKKNIEKATNIFFSGENFNNELKENKGLQDFHEKVFNENGEVGDQDLKDILGNFDTNIDGININHLDNSDQEKASKLLNNCFELEIDKLLDGKNTNNYNTTAIEEMKSEILDDNITENPLEKLQKFKELKLSLQTSIASKFVETEKLLKTKDINQLKSEKNTLAKLYNNLKKNLDKIFVNTSKNKILKEILENYKKIDNKIKGGEVVSGGGDLDKNKTGTEIK